MKFLPESNTRSDWPRLVAQTVNALINRKVTKGTAAMWTAATGTADRGGFATHSAQTISNPPTQAEVQAIDDKLVEVSEALKALIDDLQSNETLS